MAVTQCAFDSESTPRVEELAEALEEQIWPAMPKPGLIFDATRYEIKIEGFQDEIFLFVHGPDAGPEEIDVHPAILWAKDLRSVLGACQDK
jgi:hypothetical protein